MVVALAPALCRVGVCTAADCMRAAAVPVVCRGLLAVGVFTRAGVLSERTADCMRAAAVPVVCRGLLVVAGVCAELCTGVEVFAVSVLAVPFSLSELCAAAGVLAVPALGIFFSLAGGCAFAAFAFAVRLIIVGEDGVCAASIVLSRAGTFATEALAADEVGGTTLT